MEGELMKAAAEVKHLREEESSLRQENLQLRVCFLMLHLSGYYSDSFLHIIFIPFYATQVAVRNDYD